MVFKIFDFWLVLSPFLYFSKMLVIAMVLSKITRKK